MDGSSAEKASLRKRQNRRKHQGRVDSATAASLQEAFKREERALWRFLKKLDEEGKLDAYKTKLGQLQGQKKPELDVDVAEYVRQHGDSIPLSMSRNIWVTSNPGYWLSSPEGKQEQEDMEAFATLQAELMAEQHRLDGDHRRQRNDMTDYMEAAAVLRRVQVKADPATGN